MQQAKEADTIAANNNGSAPKSKKSKDDVNPYETWSNKMKLATRWPGDAREGVYRRPPEFLVPLPLEGRPDCFSHTSMLP